MKQTRSTFRAVLVLAVWLQTGCFTLQSLIDGTYDAAEDTPFVSESAPSIESNPALPQQADLIHRFVLVGDAVVQMECEETFVKQIDAKKARRIFIPGNYNWGPRGADRLLRQQAYPNARQIELLPRDGWPGAALRNIVSP